MNINAGLKDAYKIHANIIKHKDPTRPYKTHFYLLVMFLF